MDITVSCTTYEMYDEHTSQTTHHAITTREGETQDNIQRDIETLPTDLHLLQHSLAHLSPTTAVSSILTVYCLCRTAVNVYLLYSLAQSSPATAVNSTLMVHMFFVHGIHSNFCSIRF
ncbi:hypothetical protein J6590_103765 [Homalodisca vitripennis]|nr:hypothetical protein J6590_103765 [Homalodisca vitripennis]